MKKHARKKPPPEQPAPQNLKLSTKKIQPLTDATFPIVGIGASAGGLEAITQMLYALPFDTGLAFVIIQHLDPKHESILADLLARSTKMPVLQVKDGMAVKPNHIFVVPPNVIMGMEDGMLRLAPRPETRSLFMPIDIFFRSLAENHRSQAIGIVLSGTGSDGALGLEDIKEKEGITFAQDEKTAKFAGMPHSAISTGRVDFVLPVESIVQELIRIARHPYVHSSPPSGNVIEEPPPPAGQNALNQIIRLLRGAMGTDFTHYKINTIRRRITRRMALQKMEQLEDYVIYLKKCPDELKALYHEILIKVTGFFRDPQTFEVLKTVIIPSILKNHPSEKPIRIWVPGCASGEEVYSIAICFLECLGDKTAAIQIFATDIDEIALQKARTGLYIESIALDVPPEYLRRFFSKVDHSYRIHKTIRDMCTFAKHDLSKDPPFSNLDLVSCRNVLIYFEPVLQKRVLPIFHYALNPDGFLTLGNSESIGAFADLFNPVDKTHKIYAKKLATVHPPVDFTPREYFRADSKKIHAAAPPTHEPLWKEQDIYKEADRILLNNYAPASVLINEQMDILQFRGNTGHYLLASPGKASLNLLKMARDGLLAEIKRAVEKAKKTGASIVQENIRFRYEEKFLNVTLNVIPLKIPPPASRYFMVLFEEVFSPVKKKGRDISTKKEIENQENNQLKQELDATKEYLQSIIENHEAVNEELKSANEEILSSNEELQSTNEELETAKEELQSTNEELHTVNEDIQHRNNELSKANNDLDNLFASSNLPMIMLGNNLRIRRFTSMTEKALNIIATDIGRPMGDLKLNIDIPDLETLILSVIDSVKVLEREVQDRFGRWYNMQIRPYKTTDHKIDGVVLLFIDIDPIKKTVEQLTISREELRIARNYSEGIVQTARTPLLILDVHLLVITANPMFYEIFKVSKEEVERRFIYSLGNNQWDIPKLREMLNRILTENVQIENFEVAHDFPKLGPRIMMFNARRILVDGAGTQMILVSFEDITDRKHSEKQMISLKEKDVLLKEIHHRVKNNLQIISSLFNLRSESIEDQSAQQLFKESQERIRAIALVHEKLYASKDLSQIDMESYLQSLAAHLLRSYGKLEDIDLKIQAEGVRLEVDIAIPFGLILNELLSNIFKHAFPEGKKGRVWIEMSSKLNQMTLIIQDDGIGIPNNIDIAKPTTLGLRLVEQLVEQLRGHLDLDRSSGGTKFTVEFPSQAVGGGIEAPLKKENDP